VRHVLWALAVTLAATTIVLGVIFAPVALLLISANGEDYVGASAPAVQLGLLLGGPLLLAAAAAAFVLLTRAPDERAVPLWWIARLATGVLLAEITLTGVQLIDSAATTIPTIGPTRAVLFITAAAAAVALAWTAAVVLVYRRSTRWFHTRTAQEEARLLGRG
jgi:hypothetical protein